VNRRSEDEWRDEAITCREEVGEGCEDRFNASSRGAVQQECFNHCAGVGVEGGSPKGPGSGMPMLTYYMNRGGKGLSASRKKELEKAKGLLSEKVKQAREKDKE
jgi:tRNA(adenine34) deaminase